jgi:DNA-binding NarL/FixJ family response regulator
VIRVAIRANDAATRDGIASLLEGAPGLEMVGAPEDDAALVHLLGSAGVDVVVLVPEPDVPPDALFGLAEEAAVIALVADGVRAAGALRAGARAVLLRPADRAELVAAVQAVAAGLSVVLAGLLDDLLQPSGVGNATSMAMADAEALTPRELEVLALVAAGASNKLIARRLDISVHTAKFHVAGILEKLGAGSRAEAVGIAARLGLVLL